MGGSVANASRFVRLGGRSYPVVLPTWRDPRLHSAAIISSLQVLGQTVLAFELSISQILLSLVTCAVLEMTITLRQQKVLMWPASALLTGNSVAFILRVAGTRAGDWWSLNGAWIFVFAASVSLLSKYVLRIGNRHVFNPSNFGLVLCFLLFGSRYTNPQDLWWGPISPSLGLTLVIITVGGLVITGELKMLPMVLAFWTSFAAFIGVIAAHGHCITARWHYGPICGQSFWLLLITSPEILVFIFFMMTDPKTAPQGNLARLAYGFGLAFTAALLIAPWRTEFATKVALLGGLIVICGLRPLVERHFPAPGSDGDRVRTWIRWLVIPRSPAPRLSARGRLPMLASLSLASLTLCTGSLLAVANLGATSAAAASVVPVIDESAALRRPVIIVDPSTIPSIVISASVSKFDANLTKASAQGMVQDLVEDLLIAGDAIKELDPKLAATAAAGRWLQTLQRDIASAKAAGQVVVPTYRFDMVSVVLVSDPSDPQKAPEIAVRLRGVTHRVTYAISTGATQVSQSDSAYVRTFGLVLVGRHYLILDDYTARPTR